MKHFQILNFFKIAFLFFVILIFNHASNAQWTSTGTIPTTKVYTGGNVGIGTDNPDVTLHISKDRTVAETSSSPIQTLLKIGLRTTDGHTQGGVENRVLFTQQSFSNGASSIAAIGAIRGIDGNGWYGGGNIKFYTLAPAPGGTSSPGMFSRMIIDRFGNIGIGTENPDATLHIINEKPITEITTNPVQTIVKIGLRSPDAHIPAGTENRILFTQQSYSNNATSIAAIGAVKGMDENGWYGGGSINFYTTAPAPGGGNSPGMYNRMIIDRMGNIGINTTTPDPLYKLSVNGSIRAKEIKVNTGWSDYVFFDSYKLRPLSEVETFIQENKHLPDVPSAAVVEKEGVNLGEMDAILLRKIEELTLYVIEIKKENELLRNQDEKLKKEIELLKQEKLNK